MSRAFGGLLVVLVALGAVPAFAQTMGAGKADFTLMAGGGWFFTAPDRKTEPSFGDYAVGGAITVNLGPVGVEAEIAGGIGLSQNLEFRPGMVVKKKTPHIVAEGANLVVPLIGNRHTVVPYVAAGIGEVTLERNIDTGQTDTETFFAGNVGGGVKKWYSGRWGLRGDYRFFIVRSSDVAAGTFFGRQLRHAHRFYGGIMLNLIR